MSVAETLKKPAPRFHWKCKHTWRRSAKNTSWCLLGCSIGDFGTILYFQSTGIPWPTLYIMILAIINGIITSIILETVVLSRQMIISKAFKTAIGMSLISMVSMEIAMNAVDWIIMGCQTCMVGNTYNASCRISNAVAI